MSAKTMGLLAGLAETMGVAEPAIRLMLTLFMGYPLGWLYRQHFYRAEAVVQHGVITGIGLGLMYFNFGLDVLHSMASVVLGWALVTFLGGTRESVIAAFVALMGHLLWGYWVSETALYDINWTMAQCILTLRLIGLVWDVYDGSRAEAELSKDEKETAVRRRPDLLEVAAYSYFFGSFLVGPQLPLVRFRAWIRGDFSAQPSGGPPDSVVEAGKRLGAGVGFLLLHLFLTPYFPSEQFFTAEWLGASLVWKHVLAVCWYRIRLLQYQSAWLITEGVCILVGLSHNGLNPDGSVNWDGLRNSRLRIFETGCSFQSIIDSFNLNTNRWAARYVFKRLKFLGNKTLSQAGTLAFLAIWHGWHLGYFFCFFGEFLTVTSEKQIVALVKRVPKLDELLRGKLWPLTWLVCKCIMLSSSCFFFLSFGLIKKERWFPVYNALYWDGFLVYLFLWPLAHYALRMALPRHHSKPSPTAPSQSQSQTSTEEAKKEL